MNKPIDKLIAEKVMGWSNVTPKGNISEKSWYGKFNGKYMYIYRIQSWYPSSNMQQAWKVVERLNALNIITEISNNSKRGYHVEMLRYDEENDFVDSCTVNGDDASYTICECALKILGG